MALSRWRGYSISVASFGIFLFIGFCFAEKAPFTSFTKDATLAPPSVYYDYIIIGGGTTGCALAATLSSSAKVLLLERGGSPYGKPNIINKNGVFKTLADTSPNSAAQPFISTDGVFNHRPRILGGGSAINFGFYSRAEEKFVHEVGWDPQLVNSSYEWVEKKVVFQPVVQSWQAAMQNGLLEAGVLPYRGFTFEHLKGTKVGGSIFDESGHRHTAADLLEYADPTNIDVYLHGTVNQILFKIVPGQRPEAYGVKFTDSKSSVHMAYLNNESTNEIILSAGAIGSPQLLMLSGIGPTHQLQAQGIDVILDQQMVGQDMSDNPMNPIIIPSPRPIEYSLVEVVGISETGNYIEGASGLLELALVNRIAQDFAKLVNQTIEPFLFSNITIGEVAQGPGPSQSTNFQVGVILEKIARPFSRGYIELESRNPYDNPRVTFNYFQDPRDLQQCVQGMEIIKRVVESRSFSPFRYPLTSFQSLKSLLLALPNNLRKKHLASIYSMEQYCIDTVMTIWHYHGGCQLDRVVDHDYKVIGVDALRVIDGSTFYNSPGTNPQATLMMLGRYMGQKIMRDRIPQ